MKHQTLLLALFLCTLPTIAMDDSNVHTYELDLDEKEIVEQNTALSQLYATYDSPRMQAAWEQLSLPALNHDNIHTLYEKTNRTLTGDNLAHSLSTQDYVTIFARYYQLHDQQLLMIIQTDNSLMHLLPTNLSPDSIKIQEISYTLRNQADLHAWRERCLEQKTRNAKNTLDSSPTEDNMIRFLHTLATQMAINDKLATRERAINDELERNAPVTITIQQFRSKPAPPTFLQSLGNAGIAVIKGIRSFIGV